MITSRTQIPAEVNNFYSRTLLMRAVPLFLHTRFGQVRDIPQNSGTSVIKFRRYGNLAAATTPLTEGTTPAGSQMSVTDITATVRQYGDFTTFTDVLSYESIDPILTEFAEILGDQAGETMDILARDIMAGGTSVTFVGQVAQNAITTANLLTGTEVRKAVRTLKNNKARRITRMITATTGVATEPVAPAFVGIIHPDTTFDLQADAAWVPVEKYSSTMTLLPGEVGKIGDTRFVESANAKVFEGVGDGGIDVYGTVILASDAYGITRISGASLQNIVKPLGDGGTTDPLNQRGTTGWKATFVARILNDDFMHRIEHAVTS